MRRTCLLLLLSMPGGAALASAAAAHDNPFLIRASEAPVLPAVRPAEPLNAPQNLPLADEVDIDTVRVHQQSPPRTPSGGRLLGESLYGGDRLAKVVDDKLVIPPLIAPTTEQSSIGSGRLPVDRGGQVLSDVEPLPEGPLRGPEWDLSASLWHAPNTFSYPLYFEDVMLERHGHERFPHLTPLASGARFFATIPALPYLMTVRDPHECYYHLGYFRVGSCAPPLLQRPPYERRAAIVTGATVGALYALP